MPFYICPNCKRRSVDTDGYEGFSSQAVQCRNCGFGFLYELLEDYSPAPATGFVVCDREARVLAAGRGVFELTGFRDGSESESAETTSFPRRSPSRKTVS